MKPIAAILILIVVFSNSYAQETPGENPVKVTGKVLNEKSMEPVSFANLLDITRSTGTSANENGELAFIINKSDTMKITAIGYEDTYISLKDSSDKKIYYLTIRLKPKAYLLQEVEIYANNPMAGFRRDTTHTTKYQFNTGSNDYTGRVLGSQTESASGYITAFADLFNRHAKEEKKLNKILDAQNKEQAAKNYHDSIQMMVNSRYNKLVVGRITNLKGDDLDEFIKEYRPSDIFILTASNYDFALQIVNSFYDFQKKHGFQVDIDEILRKAVFKN